jgi:hypothetical protein
LGGADLLAARTCNRHARPTRTEGRQCGQAAIPFLAWIAAPESNHLPKSTPHLDRLLREDSLRDSCNPHEGALRSRAAGAAGLPASRMAAERMAVAVRCTPRLRQNGSISGDPSPIFVAQRGDTDSALLTLWEPVDLSGSHAQRLATICGRSWRMQTSCAVKP